MKSYWKILKPIEIVRIYPKCINVNAREGNNEKEALINIECMMTARIHSFEVERNNSKISGSTGI